MNPGTPVYVGYLCIILRRQKLTSRYICITPLLVKLAYFLPPKKLWWIHMYLFSARTKYVCACARRAAQIRTFSSVLSELFLRVFCVFRALAAARENLPLSYCHANATTAVALPLPTPRRHAFTLTPPPPLSPPRQRHANRCLRGCCAVVITSTPPVSHELSSFAVREACCCSQKLPALSLC